MAAVSGAVPMFEKSDTSGYGKLGPEVPFLVSWNDYRTMIMSDAADTVVDIAAKHDEIVKYKRELIKSLYI